MPAPILELRSVIKGFTLNDRFLRVFDGFSLAVRATEIVSILGPSGCGKTTLLRLMAGLDRPDSGTVLFEGDPVDIPPRGIAMMFQSYDCFPWMTVAANVRLGLSGIGITRTDMEDRVQQTLVRVGLSDVRNAYPYQLSGGMRQRVALGRTLVTHPHVLLMDEPFGALDAQIREELQDNFLDLFRRREITSSIFVTHDMVEAIRLGTRIVVLNAKPAKVFFDAPTRRAQATAPSDEELMVRCREALRTVAEKM